MSQGVATGIRLDGSAKWGYQQQLTNLVTLPFGRQQIAAGHLHLCGIQDTGDIACVGDDTYGQASPPPSP